MFYLTITVKQTAQGTEKMWPRKTSDRLTLKVLVMAVDALGLLLNSIITAQWEGMGDVGSARYEPALLPPCNC